MLPVNCGSHSDYQNFVVKNLRKYYPNPDSIARSTWDIIDRFWNLDLSYTNEKLKKEIEDFPDLNCDVEHSVLTKMEQQDIHRVIDQLNTEERMIIYGIFFDADTDGRDYGDFQTGISVQAENNP